MSFYILQVAQNKSLDRERQSVLRLEVQAADTPKGGQEQLKAFASILIDVLDVNDNAPQFDKPQYTGKLYMYSTFSQKIIIIEIKYIHTKH